MVLFFGNTMYDFEYLEERRWRLVELSDADYENEARLILVDKVPGVFSSAWVRDRELRPTTPRFAGRI